MEFVIEFLVKLNCFAKSYRSYALFNTHLIGNMDRSLTRKKGCRYLLLVCIWLVFPWLQTHWSHLILTFLANKVDDGRSLRIACKSSWIVCIIYRIKKTKRNKTKSIILQKEVYQWRMLKCHPWEESGWMKKREWLSIEEGWWIEEAQGFIYEKKVDEWKSMRYLRIEKKVDEWKSTKYLSMRSRLRNERSTSTIHEKKVDGWKITSIIHEKKFDGWKSTCTYLSMRRRWMNEEAQGTYPWEDGR